MHGDPYDRRRSTFLNQKGKKLEYTLDITISKQDLAQMVENDEKIALFRWVDDGYGLKQANGSRVVFKNLLVWYAFEPEMMIKQKWTDDYYFFMSQSFDGKHIVMNAYQNLDSRKQYEFKDKLFKEIIMEGQLIEGAYYLLNSGGAQLAFGLAQKNYDSTTGQDTSIYPLNIRTLADGSATYFMPLDKIGISVVPSVQPGQLINIAVNQIIVKELSTETKEERFLKDSHFSISMSV